MRRLHNRFASLVALSAFVFVTGCSEVNSTIDRAQACLEAPKIVADLTAQLASLANDPQAMEKALDDTAAKLNDVADQAANTTIKEASDDLAATLSGINVQNVNDAVDATQKVGADTAAYVEKVAQACTG
jgi:cytoskeletal protein RodZ